MTRGNLRVDAGSVAWRSRAHGPVVSDNAGSSHPASRFFCLERAYIVAPEAHCRGRDQGILVVLIRAISASTKPGGVSSASPWKLITRSGSWSCASASAQRSVPLRHSGDVMMTPTFAGAQPSAIRSSSVTTNTPETPRTRRAASTLRWISGLGDAGRAFQFDERLARITRRGIARRDQDDGVHRVGRAVMDVEHANRLLSAAILLDHEQRRDPIFLEHGQSVVDQRVRIDGLGIARS